MIKKNIELKKAEITIHKDRSDWAFLSSFGNIIANSYLPVTTELMIRVIAINIDKTPKSFVIQVTALRRDIDKLIANLKPLGLISTSRTGAVAMTRGKEVFTQ